MRIGLVFAGGGGKGAYHIGVWRALEELDLTQYVTQLSGTSIGAFNASLFLTRNYDEAERIWLEIERYKLAPLKYKWLLNPIKLKEISSKHYLKAFIQEHIIFDKIRSSSIRLSAAVTGLKGLQLPRHKVIHLNPLSEEEIIDWLTASCTIPVFHKGEKIDDTYYYDGGITTRAPIEGLDFERLDYVIVVHLDDFARLNFMKYRHSKIVNIFPSKYQGLLIKGTYGFTPELAKVRIELGYNDAKKKLRYIQEYKYD